MAVRRGAAGAGHAHGACSAASAGDAAACAAPLQWSDDEVRRDRPARAVAAAAAARSVQPRLGQSRRHRAGRASVQRPAPVGRRRHELRHLPSARAATGATVAPRRSARSSSTAARRRCGTWAMPTGSAGTARAIRCGRSRIRPILDRREMAGDTARVAILLREDKALACGYAASVRREARRRRREAAGRCRQGAGGLPGDAGQPAHAVRRFPRYAGCRRSQAAARYPVDGPARPEDLHRRPTAAPAISGRASPTASSATSASRSSRGRARSMPAGSTGSPSCADSPSTSWAGTTTMPRAPAPCARGTSQRLHSNFGEFRVPSLRQAASGPYMHNGQLATLEDVVRHYSEVNPDRLHSDAMPLVRPLGAHAAAERRPRGLPALARRPSAPPTPGARPPPLCP